MSRPDRTLRAPRPLDDAALERLALRSVERFATTRGRLGDYLARKLRERGWTGEDPADIAALGQRLAHLGYIDDAAFGEARAAAMARRGLGARRVTQALRAAHLDADDAAALRPAIDARAGVSALAFARRKRIGPYAAAQPDRPAREKALVALLRAGHPLDLARRIVALAPGEETEDEAVPRYHT